MRAHDTPVVDRSFPLSETAEAIAHLATGRTRGKIVLDIANKEER